MARDDDGMVAEQEYPPELRERAIRMALAAGSDPATTRVAEQLGIRYEVLRNWLRTADINEDLRPGTTSEVVGMALSQVVGLRTWTPWIGHGSFLTVDFGRPRITSRGITQGEFSLWIYGSCWSIRKFGDNIATSEQDRASMIAGAYALGGVVLREFVFDPDPLTLTLRFDDDLELLIPALEDPEMEEWFLFLDDGAVITAGPGTAVIRESASR